MPPFHEEDDIQEIHREKRKAPRPPLLNLFIIALCIIASLPVVLAAWHSLYTNFFESTAPVITPISLPTGLGSSQTKLVLKLSDSGSGLDEVVVRLQQKKGTPKELFKQDLEGAAEKEVSFDLGGEESGLDSGTATISVKVFDKSFWSNVQETLYPFKVDYKKPRAEIVTPMHNARIGGAQLAFYKTFDEDHLSSGVKVGDHFFPGSPAQEIDPLLEELSLRVVLYALPLESKDDVPVKLYAQDAVKNISLFNFYNLVLPRKLRTVTIPVSGPVIPPVVRDDFSGQSKNSVHKAAWELPFLVPKGSIHHSYGDELIYKKEGKEVQREVVTGYTFLLPPAQREVIATNDGRIASIGKSRIHGYAVIVDHGLGLSSIYDRLEGISVKKGDSVTRGATLGTAGVRAGAKTPDFYFEMRVHGVAVDAREWWEARWCQEHITKKIQDVRKLFGLFADQTRATPSPANKKEP
jgi:murein DD-endopeptidase MepM/ murein hydrolase activator NlpD